MFDGAWIHFTGEKSKWLSATGHVAQKRPDRWLSNTGTMAHFEQIIHDWITDLMISCVLSYVMHLDPQLVREEVKTEAQLLLWGNVVVAIREYSATRYSGSSLPTEAVVPYIVQEILVGLEKLIMGPPTKLPE